MILFENEARPLKRYFQLSPDQAHLDCRDWLPETLFDDGTITPFESVAAQWFHPWPVDPPANLLAQVVEIVPPTSTSVSMQSEELISKHDYQRLRDDLARLRSEHNELQQRTEEIMNQLMQSQAHAQQQPGPAQEVLQSQGRTYGSTTITRGATAVMGDIVYIFQDAYQKSRPTSEYAVPAVTRW